MHSTDDGGQPQPAAAGDAVVLGSSSSAIGRTPLPVLTGSPCRCWRPRASTPGRASRRAGPRSARRLAVRGVRGEQRPLGRLLERRGRRRGRSARASNQDTSSLSSSKIGSPAWVGWSTGSRRRLRHGWGFLRLPGRPSRASGARDPEPRAPGRARVARAGAAGSRDRGRRCAVRPPPPRPPYRSSHRRTPAAPRRRHGPWPGRRVGARLITWSHSVSSGRGTPARTWRGRSTRPPSCGATGTAERETPGQRAVSRK